MRERADNPSNVEKPLGCGGWWRETLDRLYFEPIKAGEEEAI
jgi:hypothetical protein